MKETIERLNQEYSKKDPSELLLWAKNTFKNTIAQATSFGAEDMVITDLLLKDGESVRIFTLDTGRLPQETYDLWQKVQEKYGINIEPYFPDNEKVQEMLKRYGPNLFYKSVELRKLCCSVRKVEPLSRALKGLSAWITGLRKEQSVTRTGIELIEIDHLHGGIIKINPLANWTEKEVWEYIRKNKVPYNELHDKNYPSIGCSPCTRPIKEGEDIRAGRWWWETANKKECGLHADLSWGAK